MHGDAAIAVEFEDPESSAVLEAEQADDQFPGRADATGAGSQRYPPFPRNFPLSCFVIEVINITLDKNAGITRNYNFRLIIFSYKLDLSALSVSSNSILSSPPHPPPQIHTL
jgi:hypothetical protein